MSKKFEFGVYDYSPTGIPVFEESTSNEWVTMGEDNLYPYYLESLMLGSGMHNAIVKGVADMIYGHGFDSPTKDSHIDQWLRLNVLFGDGTCLKRAALDLKLYGQCYLNPIWSQDRTTIAEVHHIPAASIRAGKANDQDEVEVYYHSADWSQPNKYVPQAIPAFSTRDRTAASQIVQIKLYNPTSFFYGLPDYIGGVSWVECDKRIAEFHAANLQSGLFPSMLISFNNGVPTEEERRRMEQLIYDKFGGSTNAGKFLMTFNDSAENAPTFESLSPTDPQKTYAFMSSEITTRVLTSHRVTSPLLFGLRTEGGGFGNNADEMKESYELFHNTVIRPMQETMIRGLRPMLSAMNITLDLYFSKLQPASFLFTEEVNASVDQATKDASYNGAQIASAVEVLVKVQEGILTEEQAKVFLVQMLQFTPVVADALFTEGISAIEKVVEEEEQAEIANDADAIEQQLSAYKISLEDGDSWLSHLADKNAPVPMDKFVLLKTEQVGDPNEDRRLHSDKYNFNLEDYSNIDLQSEWGDVISPAGNVFAVRYSYFKAAKSTPKGESRDFCIEMMDLSDSGVEYRYEDIALGQQGSMSDAGENGQFAESGLNRYDIFEFAGGKNCYHGWQRNIYIFAPEGEAAVRDRLPDFYEDWDATMRSVGNNPYVVQKGDEAVAMIDKQ